MMPAHDYAVIFDLDGTLVDSVADIGLALNQALAETGIAAREEQVRLWIGNGAQALVEKALRASGYGFSAEFLQHATTRFIAAYARSPAVHTRPYPHAIEILAQLGRAGVPIGVCTNKPEAVARLVLERCDLSRYLQSLIGGGSRFPPKPCPDALIACAGELGRSCGDTIFVGDSPVDLATARAASCASVLVEYGYSAEPVGDMGADACIASLAQLPEAIRAIRLAAKPPAMRA